MTLVHSGASAVIPTAEPYPPVLARLEMIVTELEGLPHVVATCRDAANLIRLMDAHLWSIRSVEGSCPQCADTKRDCANAIAEMAVKQVGTDERSEVVNQTNQVTP